MSMERIYRRLRLKRKSRAGRPSASPEFCNAIALAQASDRGRRQPIPAFTERVNVADNGIDAEWEREFTADELGSVPGSYLRTGSNVFQYKKREAGRGNRNKGIAALVGHVIDIG